MGDLSDLFIAMFIFQDKYHIPEWITDLGGRKTETFSVNILLLITSCSLPTI